jgi:hypothetical protein
MLRLAFAVLAVVLVGTAGAEGWRKLQLDGSSEAAFSESVALFQDKLSPSRRMAFALALQDVWIDGTQKASAEQREYTAGDYLQELDGLRYDEVVKLTDPTGEKAKRYRARYYYTRACGERCRAGTWPTSPTEQYREPGMGYRPHGNYRGGTDLFGPAPGNPAYPGN